MHIRRFGTVVEEQHLAGMFIQLGMCGNTLCRELTIPGGHAQGFHGDRVELVQFTALIETGEGDTAMYYDIG